MPETNGDTVLKRFIPIVANTLVVVALGMAGWTGQQVIRLDKALHHATLDVERMDANGTLALAKTNERVAAMEAGMPAVEKIADQIAEINARIAALPNAFPPPWFKERFDQLQAQVERIEAKVNSIGTK